MRFYSERRRLSCCLIGAVVRFGSFGLAGTDIAALFGNLWSWRFDRLLDRALQDPLVHYFNALAFSSPLRMRPRGNEKKVSLDFYNSRRGRSAARRLFFHDHTAELASLRRSK